MGKQWKAKCIFVLGVILFLGICGIFWYFFVYAKTPEYSVQMIQKAVERHDKERFREYVDLDAVLDDAYDELVLGIMDAEQTMPEETKAAVEDLVRVLKAPLITSFQTAVDSYVVTGSWESENLEENSMDFQQALQRAGLKDASFRGIDGIYRDEEKGTAIVKVRVYQADAGAEFVLDAVLAQTEQGTWRVERIENFRDFVSFVGRARQAELAKYVETTADIMAQHEKTMRDADFEFQRIISAGSLGRAGTRADLKNHMEQTVLKDWKDRRSELEEVAVPEEAQSLHRLRLRICDLHIEYAEGYAAWLDDKKAATLREAEAKLRQARTLEQEARFLAKRMGGSPNDI